MERDKNVVVALLARDCEKALAHNRKKIEYLCSFFKQYSIVVVENDSKDNTKQVLLDWSRDNENVHLVMNDFGTLTIQSSKDCDMRNLHRIGKMANYRNMYLDYICKHIKFIIDYLVVIDVDILDFSVKGILSAIEKAPKSWGGLFANGTERLSLFNIEIATKQYDIFAFEKKIDELSNARTRFYWKRKLGKLISKNNYFECISAFGGIGVYKWEAIKDLKYGLIENKNVLGEFLAEHTFMHRDIVRKGYKNYISKSMKVDYGRGSLRMFIRTIFP